MVWIDSEIIISTKIVYIYICVCVHNTLWQQGWHDNWHHSPQEDILGRLKTSPRNACSKCAQGTATTWCNEWPNSPQTRVRTVSGRIFLERRKVTFAWLELYPEKGATLLQLYSIICFIATDVYAHLKFLRRGFMLTSIESLKAFVQGIVGSTPTNVPLWEIPISALYSGYLRVHPIVPWFISPPINVAKNPADLSRSCGGPGANLVR